MRLKDCLRVANVLGVGGGCGVCGIGEVGLDEGTGDAGRVDLAEVAEGEKPAMLEML